jgi:hypothetical protein
MPQKNTVNSTMKEERQTAAPAGLDLAADDELQEVEADEYGESGVERFEPRGCQQGGQ